MKNTFLKKLTKSFGIVLCALLFLITSTNSFGQTLNVKSVGGGAFDAASITNTTPYTNVAYTPGSILFSGLPTDVSGYAGVDVLYLQWASGGQHITQAQADAILQYVKDGGVLVYNSEGQQIIDPANGIRPSYVGAFLATELTCGNSMECLTINHMAGNGIASTCIGDGPFTSVSEPNVYHAGDGNLLVTDGVQQEIEHGTTGRCTPQSSTIAWYVGVPPENAILLANPQGCVTNSSGAGTPCSALAVLDLVAPAYPGTLNECGVQGMALISGEINGILQGTFSSNDRAYNGCLEIFNANYANLVYDFLNDPAAMTVRNAWSSNAANVSTTCGIGGGAGTIDCAKTQIATAPVVGEPSQKTLMVTINVTTAGCLSPITISGSGMSIANGITEVCTTTTGIQTFSIPIDYDGSALGTTNFTVGTGNDCTADLTNTPKEVITSIYTLDCVPTAGPSLK